MLTISRITMWLLLFVVGGAAAVLSFSALRDLALLCSFARSLAWLLPVVIDAGAAAGCLVWLSTPTDISGQPGRPFARTLTIVLLASSVAGNAVVHGLSAYHLTAPWWLVVAVSAVAPAVLGAVVHLAVLVSRGHVRGTEWPPDSLEDVPGYGETPDWWAGAPYAATFEGRAAELIDSGAGRRRLADALDISEHQARQLIAARNGAAA